MIYLIQALSILFAIVLAKHDGPAVITFERYGVLPQTMAVFHRYNVWAKIFFCIVISLIPAWNWVDMAYSGILSFLWIYLVFDIALNLSRGREWNYLGSNDGDGRRWKRIFKSNPGLIKAIVLSVLIAAVNILRIKPTPNV